MYIRIQDNSVRFRLSREEASSILDNQIISHQVCLSPELNLKYSVEVTDSNSDFSFDKSIMEIKALVNKSELQNEILDRPTKKGIELFRGTRSNEPSLITLEVDVKKLKKH